ncbi:MAG: DUF4342 domain-containing protein [Balneolaceae bacterium]
MTTKDQTLFEEIGGTVNQIIEQIKEIIRKGNARRIVIKSGKGKVLFQSQLTMGVAGSAVFTIAAPVITAITTILLLVNDVQVLVEKNPDHDTDENEIEAECIEVKDDEDEPENSEEEKKSS